VWGLRPRCVWGPRPRCVWGRAGRRYGRREERRAWRRARGVTRARGGFLTVPGESHMLLCEVTMDAVRAALRGDGGRREEGG